MVINQRLGVFFPEYHTHFVLTKYFNDYHIFTNEAMSVWLEKFIPKKYLIKYDTKSVEFDTRFELLNNLVEKSNINITTSWLTSDDDRKWAKKRGIKLIGPPIDLVLELNNKLDFDKFLEVNDIKKPDTINKPILELPENKKLVIQIANSWGSEGTFFIQNLSEIKYLISKGVLDKDEKYLVREFVEGLVYGITLFISYDKVIISPLRTQHYFDQESNGKKLYAGIQWINSQTLSEKLIEKVNDIFSKIGKIIHSKGYLGYANFDFIYDGKEVFIIECNPRNSLANSHIFADNSIMHGFDTLAIFIDEIINAKKVTTLKNPEIYKLEKADSTEGSAILIPNGKKTVIDSNGIYNINGSNYDLIDLDIRNFSNDKNILLYTDWFYTQPEIDEDVAQITLNIPIFTSNGLNDMGRRLFKNG